MTIEMTTMSDRPATDANFPSVCEAGGKHIDPSVWSSTAKTVSLYVATQEHTY